MSTMCDHVVTYVDRGVFNRAGVGVGETPQKSTMKPAPSSHSVYQDPSP